MPPNKHCLRTMSAVSNSNTENDSSDDESDSNSDSGKCYENERGAFEPGAVPDKTQSPTRTLRKLEHNVDRPASWSDDYPYDRVQRKRDALEENFELEVMPLDAEKTEVEFLTRDIGEKTLTKSFEDAYEVVTDPLADEPDEFDHQTVYRAVSEDVVDCSRCEGSGESCNECRGRGYVSCPNRDCYNGVIETDCDQCNGTGEYYRRKNSSTKTECNKCNYNNRVKQGQCNTCGGNPPIGKTGYIECSDCDGDGVGDECNRCNGRGELKEQAVKVITYDVEEAEDIQGHQCAKDKSGVAWEETGYKLLTDDESIAELPVDSSDDVARARVTTYDAHMYEGRVEINGEEVRLIQSDGGNNLACTHKYVKVSEHRFWYNILMAVVFGGIVGAGLMYVDSVYSILPATISGVPVTTQTIFAVPIIMFFLYYQFFKSTYSFSPRNSYS